jgi:hypothetical protein
MFSGKDAQLFLTLVKQGQCAVLAHGEASPANPALKCLQSLGLWHSSEDHKSLIASQCLLTLKQSLPTNQDVVAAMFAALPDYQNAWANVVAAQLKDAGGRNDISALAEQVSQLGSAAKLVMNQLESASLSASDFAEVEMLLFGQGAEQAASYPKIIRALATGAELLANNEREPKNTIQLSDVNSQNVSAAWQSQRLIQMPVNAAIHDQSQTLHNILLNYQLSGELTEFEAINSSNALSWLLTCPWAYLLAHVAYAQDVWRSEQIAGGLRLEIEPSQAKHFMQPSLMQVVVTTRDDLEIQCGSLGELLLRVLQTLNIHLFTRTPEEKQASELDTLLAPFIGAMVKAKVWQFIQGSSKDIPHYQIHPSFETLPNTRLGTIGFARPGKHITVAIREQAEAWAIELSGRTRIQH